MEIPTTSHTIYRCWDVELIWAHFYLSDLDVLVKNNWLDEQIPNLALVSSYSELYACNKCLTVWHFLDYNSYTVTELKAYIDIRKVWHLAE